jgi:predicted restriction endonuclease
MVTKVEWEAILRQYRHKCAVCGESEKKLGSLDKAHLKARSKGGSQVLPMCPNCHQRFDKALLSPSECKKIGVDYKDYVKGRHAPRKSRATRGEVWQNPFAVRW